jgi:AraC-like DNA-binding protein/mannose-6-phosphate isomerase-like protein (cupin superfamily)
MNSEKLTRLASIEIGYRVDADLPIIPLAMNVRRAGCAASHAHPRAQLIFASSGVMKVVSAKDIWIVPPSQAVWVPSNAEHEVYFPGEVSLRNLFVDASATRGMPPACTVLKITPLLRELIERSIAFGDQYTRNSPGWRLMQVILDELREAEATALHLPMARDKRVLHVMHGLLKQPSDPRDLDDWAQSAGASSRTLARLFVNETGLGFGQWRQRLLLQQAVTRLGHGESVTTVAAELGYQSLSAFVGMFKRELGVTPRRYGLPQ